MNYYEELGVAPTATAEEIRAAYLRLVKLLHPDRHQDEATRKLAERQMQRLNQIVAVLLDPVARRHYDMSLAAAQPLHPATGAGAVSRQASRTWLWVAAGAVMVGALVFYYVEAAGTARQIEPPGAPAPQAAPVTEPLAKPAAPESPPAAAPRIAQPEPDSDAVAPAIVTRQPARVPVMPKAHDKPRAAITPPSSSTPAGPPASFPPPTDSYVPPATASVPAAATVAAPPSPPSTPDATPTARRGLSGVWVYAPLKSASRSEIIYPPEYIELRIREQEGRLEATYRGRYRVSDPALWPEVRFEFEGEAGRDTYSWRGPGGARGQVRLKRLSQDSLEVTWWATELGSQQSLASGTAVLLRDASTAR